MATNNRSTYNRGNSGNNRPRSSSSSTSSNRRPNPARKSKKQLMEEQARANEIRLFVSLAVCTFFFISNFGWCGVIGNFFAKFMFGLFGTVEYVLPVYIFLTSAFLLSNGAQREIVKRVFCFGIFLVAAGFILQMTTKMDAVSAKALYDMGALNKKGGGFFLGGILVLLQNLLGKAGAIIVTVLLIVIGIIVVLNFSIVEFVKSTSHGFKTRYDSMYEEDDYIDEETLETSKRRTKLDNIRVGEEPPAPKKKKVKKKPVNPEDMQELRPLPHEDLFNPDLTLQDARDVADGYADLDTIKKKKATSTRTRSAKAEVPSVPKKESTVDFFDRPEFSSDSAFANDSAFAEDSMADSAFAEQPVDSAFASSNMDSAFAENELMQQEQENAEEPVKRRRKKTKESEQEMLEERDNIAASIEETAAIAEASQAPVKEYKFPSLDLLKSGKGKAVKNNDADVRETAMKLKSTLENFGVNVTVTDYSCGPSVTRYELQPEQGVKVSKITNLADDIKLNLAAADIRIEAPIPGKPAVGIEVPNKESQAVYFRDLLESENFQKFPSNIAFAVGKDISGQVVVADIAKMPHLLVAGATGSGKSVCINTLIMSILYKAKPEDVKLIMVDPKQVELSVYNGIPHMLIPVVTDPKKAAGALNWAVLEMTNRYQLFKEFNVRNLQGYNAKVLEATGNEDGDENLKKLPQIVIIVDELADLMMVAHGEVEDAIVRLSQLARAAGIHLVIATQRPSVDVITGLIKANVPSRIAMTVSSGVDSRTILDQTGAEKLLGKGDMLFYPTGYPKPVRVQGAFLSDDEIVNVVDFLKEQSGEVTYDEKISQEIASAKVGGSGGGSSSEPEYDDYFVDAGKFIIGKDKASIGMLQRVYKIGFNRAARIMDQLSDAGVVGPEEGTKPRKVLMTMEEFENFVEEYL